MTALAAAAAIVALAIHLRPRCARLPSLGNSPAQRLRRRSAPPTAEEWAGLLDAMSAEARTGSSLTAAFHHAIQRGRTLGAAVHPSATLGTLAAVAPADPDEALVVQALCAAHALGGSVASTLDNAAALLRERATIREEARAHSAQARLSARVLTTVPIAFAGWNLGTSPSFRAALFGRAGLVSAVAGCGCNLAGWWWMRRIVGRAAA